MQRQLVHSLLVVAVVAAFSMGCGDSSSSGSGQSNEEHHHPGDGGDELAHDACHGLGLEGTVLEAALDHDGADAVTITPGATTWILHLPEGSPSFASISIPHDAGNWAFFVDHPNVLVSLTAHDGTRFDVTPEAPNEACPDDIRVDSRLHIHEGGHYVLEFSAEGAREIVVQVVSQDGDDGNGDVDPFSLAACHALHEEPIDIVASSTEDEARAGPMIMPGESFYRIALPEGPSWVGVHLPTDHTDWALFVSEEDVAFSLSHPDVGIFGISPLAPNPGCTDDLPVDNRIHIHAGGMFLLELSPEGPREVLFNIISQQEGHGGGGDEGENHDDHG